MRAALWAALLAVGFVAGLMSQPRAPARSIDPRGAEPRPPVDVPRPHAVTGLVSTVDGIPIRHAVVTLLNKTTHETVTVTSDDAGAFTATGLSGGVYRVSAKKAGFAALAYGQPNAYEQERPVVLSGGEVPALTFKLPRAGTIVGTVTDDRGEPLADAAVGLQRFEFAGGRRRLVAALAPAATDDRGAFRMTGVPPGSFLLSAVAGGTFRESQSAPPYAYAPTYYPSTTAPEEAQPIPVKEGGLVTVDVRVIRTPMLALHGLVTSASGRRDRTGFIRVLEIGRGDSSGKVAPVGRDGSFGMEILGLPGTYALTAVLGVASPADVDRHSEIARTTIQVASSVARDITGISLAAQPGAVVRGRFSVQGGSVSDLGPTRVMLQPVDPADGWPPNVSALVAPDGSFELRNVLWRGLVTTDLPNEGPWRVAGVFLGDRDISESGVDPATVAMIDAVRVVMRSRTEEVIGRVTDRRGAPCTDATILVFAADQEKWAHPLGRYVVATRPDADGRFRIPVNATGRYLVGALLSLPTGSFADPALLNALAVSSKHVDLVGGQAPAVSLTCAPPPGGAGSL